MSIFLSFDYKQNSKKHEDSGKSKNLEIPNVPWQDKIPHLILAGMRKLDFIFEYPQQFPSLFMDRKGRLRRREAREAVIIVAKALLRRMDMLTLQCALPFEFGLTNLDMKTIMKDTGLGQRRIERAIVILKNAGILTVHQPRRITNDGRIVGCRAIRTFTTRFFKWLKLDKVLNYIRSKLKKDDRPFFDSSYNPFQLKKFLKNLRQKMFTGGSRADRQAVFENRERTEEQRMERVKAWNGQLGRLAVAYPDWTPEQYRLKANQILGLPPDFRP